jgi:mono/diheme cytochrome c family protein
MKKIVVIVVLIVVIAAGYLYVSCLQDRKAQEASLVEHGRYLVNIAGCNDCHTQGYAQKAAKVDEKDWLMGDVLGWQGPWGTTYPINLRLYMQSLTEDQWVQVVRQLKSRPPMPSYILQQMTERDLRAIYRFIHSLGGAGQLAPAYLPPGVAATTPVFRLVLPAASS